MRRLEEVHEIWAGITEKLFNDETALLEYLAFAGKAFKYDFADAVLIHQQNKNATMIADMETWNRIGRRVNAQERSIAVFEGHDRLRHLFDVTATNGRKPPLQWRMNVDFAEHLLEFSANEYNFSCDNFPELIDALTADTSDKSLEELEILAKNMNLKEEDFHSLQKLHRSVSSYIVGKRCEFNTNLELTAAPQIQVKNLFKTKAELIEFCTIACKTSKSTLLIMEQEMFKYVKNVRSADNGKQYHDGFTENHLRERIMLRTGRGNQYLQREASLHERPGNIENAGNSHRQIRNEMDSMDGTGIFTKNTNAENELPMGDNSTGGRRGSGTVLGRALQRLSESEPTAKGSGSLLSLGKDSLHDHGSHNNDRNSLPTEGIISITEPTSAGSVFLSADESATHLALGDIIQIEDKDFKVDEINQKYGTVILLDLETSGWLPVFRNMSLSQAEAIYAGNPAAEISEVPENSIIVRNHFVAEQLTLDLSPNPEIVGEIPVSDLPGNTDFSHQNEREKPPKTAKPKLPANIEAIETLRNIEKDGRFATQKEQEILTKYVGWGGIPEVFDERNALNSHFNQENYDRVKSLLSPDEYESAKASTLTSFYTDPKIIQAIYSGIENFCTRDADWNSETPQWNILEPACGTGNFFGQIPEKLGENSSLYGVELDSITGRIARQLYPKAHIQIMGFEKTKFPNNSIDVAVGNVPFGNIYMNDPKFNKENFLIHDYFFAKTVDILRPNGIISFITSKGTLDKKNDKFRKYLADRCELIGAIRLPNTAFKANAGTEVTSDIIFLQKRDKIADNYPSWLNVTTDQNGIPMNTYFLDNPDMVLGKMVMQSGRFGMESTCQANMNKDLSEALKEAMAKLSPILRAAKKPAVQEKLVLMPETEMRNFSYSITNDGKLAFFENEQITEIGKDNKNYARILGLHEIRNAARTLINLQVDGCNDEVLKAAQSDLNAVYDVFVEKFGAVTDRLNSRAFEIDDDYNTICSLEIVDSESKAIQKAPIFSTRTIAAVPQITAVESPTEALHVSMELNGKVDIQYMSSICHMPQEDVVESLLAEKQIFYNPQKHDILDIYSGFEIAAEYLSGDIYRKLDIARKFIADGLDVVVPAAKINIAELEKVLPKRIEAQDIGVRIGVPWVNVEDYSKFLDEYAHGEMLFYPLARNYQGEYKIKFASTERKSIAAISTFGTLRMNSYTIFENLLNQRDTIVRDKILDNDGKEKYIINQKETQLATEKARQMEEAFPKWLWNNIDRREKYEEKYNRLFNAISGRDYEGIIQTFPNMSNSIELRPHQKAAIARAKFGGNTLLAHCVGAGKSFEMIAATMEKCRLGVVSKACVVVPKHLTIQTASEWMRLYPTAKILVASPKDFEKKNRQRFIARCVTGDYNAVIMGFSQFEKINMSAEYRQKFLQTELNEIISGINNTDKKDSYSIKDLERQKKNIEVKLDKLVTNVGKDTSLNFEELGFNSLVVDEAHNYKNCLVVSKMSNISGVSTTGAAKSEDMLMKCRYINEKTDYKGLIFATGTPVSNSMVELYTMTRYLRPDILENSELQNFDDWASNYGKVVSQLELKPAGDGFRMKKRFSKFVNLPELMASYKEFADIQTADMVKLPIPNIKGGKPEISVAQPSDFTKDYMKILGIRSEKIHSGSVDPREDNMLKVTHEARLLGLDPRSLNPNAENTPNSKVNILLDNILRIYDDTAIDRGVQVVFCDIAINSDKEKWSIYDYILDELEKRGIPKSQLCTAGDAKTDEQRTRIYSQLRSGEKRVIIASTTKLGTGANIQTRLAALHHLDIPWRPSDLEQRNGRILRQGNKFPEVEIIHYTTAETFDAYMLGIITNKQKFISQIITSKSPGRTCEDVDEMVLTYSEMQAITSGNPMIKEKLELDGDIIRLRMLESEHTKTQFALQKLADKTLPMEICSSEEFIKKIQTDLEGAKTNASPNDEFFITISGVNFGERKLAAEKLKNEIIRSQITGEKTAVGEYMGLKLSLAKSDFQGKCVAILSGSADYSCELELDGEIGNVRRIENIVSNSIPARLTAAKEKLEAAVSNLNDAKKELGKPFEHEGELLRKLTRINEVNAKLASKSDENVQFVQENSYENSEQLESEDLEI